MTNLLAQEIFWAVHRDLLREAPGSHEATRQTLAMLPDLFPVPRILDIGCGPERGRCFGHERVGVTTVFDNGRLGQRDDGKTAVSEVSGQLPARADQAGRVE